MSVLIRQEVLVLLFQLPMNLPFLIVRLQQKPI